MCVCVRHSSKGVLQWDKQNRTEGTSMNEGGRVCVIVQKVCVCVSVCVCACVIVQRVCVVCVCVCVCASRIVQKVKCVVCVCVCVCYKETNRTEQNERQ